MFTPLGQLKTPGRPGGPGGPGGPYEKLMKEMTKQEIKKGWLVVVVGGGLKFEMHKKKQNRNILKT